jgi:sortase A
MLRWIERLLWLAAAVGLGVSAFVFVEAHVYQFYLNREFELELDARAKAEALTSSAAAANARTAASPYLGRLKVPRLDLTIMLLEGVETRTLRHGIGHIPGTALPGESGNMGIAGHRDTYFRGLAGIRKHDRITVQTLDRDYEYVVDSIRIVEPDAVEVLKDSGQPVLTLVTCYPFYFVGPAPKRFIVRASLLTDRHY